LDIWFEHFIQDSVPDPEQVQNRIRIQIQKDLEEEKRGQTREAEIGSQTKYSRK
jgi:hypothetical protein